MRLSAMPNNLAALTVSHKAIAAKKYARCNQVKEILFDDEARREFLTGFHKRKKAKADAARKKAKDREKQEHLDDRRERRQALREQAQENAEKVELAYAAAVQAVNLDGNDSEDEWQGIGTSSAVEKDAEYEDKEVIATVTVVEDFDPSTLTTAGPEPTQGKSEDLHEPNPSLKPQSSHEKRPPKTQFKPKTRGKKDRYETKAGRKYAQGKQRNRKYEKAERAGGKASRQRKMKR